MRYEAPLEVWEGQHMSDDDDKRDDAPEQKPDSAAVAAAKRLMATNPRFRRAPNSGQAFIIPG